MSDNPSSGNIWKNLRFALLIAGMQIGGMLLLVLARNQGIIDGDAMTRGAMVLIGLGIAAFGNRMPKAPDGPLPPSLALAALRQAVHRVGGWALTLGGLAYAGFWAFAPRDVAVAGSVLAVGSAVAVMVGYFAWRVFAARGSSAS